MVCRFETIVSGTLGNNSYVLYDEESRDCIIIDAAFATIGLLDFIKSEGLKTYAIIATHGHYDHVHDNAKLKAALGIPVYMQEADAAAPPSSTFRAGLAQTDCLLKGDEELCFGNLKLQVLHTPGHSKGGICLLCGNMLFSGDTLFANDVGRTDLWGGNYDELLASLQGKLAPLPDSTLVLPGHGEASSIGQERIGNPYFPR